MRIVRFGDRSLIEVANLDHSSFDIALEGFDVFHSLEVSSDVRGSIINHQVVLEELLNTNGYNKIEMKAMFGHVSSDPTVTGFSNKFHKSIMTLNDEIVNGKPLLEFFPQFSRAKTANIHTYTESTNGFNPGAKLYAPFADKLQNTLTELNALGQGYEGVVVSGKVYNDDIVDVLDGLVGGGIWNNGDRFLSTSKQENVADHFINKGYVVGSGEHAVKLEIISFKGVDIDDVSLYGSNLIGDLPPNPTANFPGPIQYEVLMNRNAEYIVSQKIPETMTLNTGEVIPVFRYILEEI